MGAGASASTADANDQADDGGDVDDEAIYARSLRSENDDQLLQMDLCVKITDNTRHMLSTVDTVFAAFEPRTPDQS